MFLLAPLYPFYLLFRQYFGEFLMKGHCRIIHFVKKEHPFSHKFIL